MSRSILEKFQGCLVGSLLGDCFGSTFEGRYVIDYEVLLDYFSKLMNEDEKYDSQIYTYTDDTAMTRSVASSLIENKGFDGLDMAKKFTDEYKKQRERRYGLYIGNVFRALERENFVDVYGPARKQFNGKGSYGNGAAMRISPVALFCYENEDLLMDIAKNCSLITHSHSEGYNGAILQCLAVHQALCANYETELDPLLFVDYLISKMNHIEDTWLFRKLFGNPTKVYVDQLEIVRCLLSKDTDLSCIGIAELLGHGTKASESVPTAIYSFLRAQKPLKSFETDNPFSRTLYYSISLGGDADTISSMACSIAGAYYGIDSIPTILQNKCEGIDVSLQLADELLKIVSDRP